MGLLGNGFRHNLTGRISTATTALDGANASTLRASYNLASFRRNSLIGSGVTGSTASVPSGCRHPVAWVMPRKAGGLSARNTVIGSGIGSAAGQSGYNIAAAVTGDGGIASAPLGLIVSVAASLIASGGISSATTQALASLVASLAGSSTFTATAQGLAALVASMSGAGAVTAGNTALMDVAATIRGYSDLTPEGIRDNVWNAIAASYNVDGTMGQKLNSAAVGGVDLDLLAQAVWEYATRSMPEAEREAIAASVWNKTLP